MIETREVNLNQALLEGKGLKIVNNSLSVCGLCT